MKHYGDITQLSGYELPIVDVIVGGSPCQDLSVAGARAGLAGERSGLFLDQVRIVKEMRERDKRAGRTGFLVRPRYMVWENVPGAFSSNGGEDFKTVIEEIVRIAEPIVPDLRTIVRGGWTKAGCVYSEMGEWSIAWRVHDAQFWGVPQRRKRIALVADFGGLSAPEILFERKGLSWNSEQSGETGEGTSQGTEGSTAFSIQGNTIDRDVKQNGGGISEEVAHTLNSVDRHASAYGFDVHAVDCRNGTENECINGTLQAKDQGTSLNLNNVVRQSLVLNDQGGGVMHVSYDVTSTLRAETKHHEPIVLIYDARGNGGGCSMPNNHRRTPESGDGLHGNRVLCFTPTKHGVYAEGLGTLRASGGDIGGGQRDAYSGIESEPCQSRGYRSLSLSPRKHGIRGWICPNDS